MTRLPGRTWLTLTLNPAALSACSASLSFIPWTSGTGTCAGPADTQTVTTSPDVIAVPGAGDCRVIVPAGCVLLLSGCWLRLKPPEDAAPCASPICWPTKLGSGAPALTTRCTGLFFGQCVYAIGFVAMTTYCGMLLDAWYDGCAGTRPAAFSVLSA